MKQVPETLEKLHLEFERNGIYFLQMQIFLDAFKNNMKYLTLIGISPNKEFSNYDKLQNLVNNFSRIETFQYHIRTIDQPDIRFSNIKKCFDSYSCFGTFPRSNICDGTSSRTTSEFSLWPDRTLEQLLTCPKLYNTRNHHHSYMLLSKVESRKDLRLLYLNEIRFCHNIEDIPSTTLQLLSKLITLSPNLQTLFIMSSCTQKMIQYLKQIFSNRSGISLSVEYQIKWINNDNYYHSMFFYELSEIFINLNTLIFQCIPKFIQEYPITLNNFILNLRKDFLQHTHFKLRLMLIDKYL
ncbi:unnamed protein product [Adineta steineri]|uniref:Uncharacterized protein n=1 Tax=Adineta steineri TaxID=433720 RepID=A0A819BB98_9BILA|nr:unnamed protein product [Adineta steineri]CAF3799085.1 unnamed protein product [Adineta steineri]